MRASTFRESVLPRRLLVLLALAQLSGCVGDPYGRARRANTVEGYRAFLREHRDHTSVEEARERLAELELAEAQRVHSALGYKRFLQEFSGTRAAPVARELLATLHFEAAVTRDTPEAYRQFLRDHPDSAHAPEVKRLFAEAELRRLALKPDASVFERLARQKPEDARVLQAAASLDDAAFSEALAKGASSLSMYLETFPTGRHRDEARAELERLELQALALSGRVQDARARLQRSVYASSLAPLAAVFERQLALDQWLAKDAAAQSATAAYHLRPKQELVEALESADALNRWEAATELGHYVSLDVVEPLLAQIRRARNVGVARAAFGSLERVLSLLPERVVGFELFRHQRLWSGRAKDPDALRMLGALHELSGEPGAAVAVYARGAPGAPPDPFVLWRMAELRSRQARWLSAAIAARQLAVWSGTVVERTKGAEEQGASLGHARHLCAARAAVSRAAELFKQAQERDRSVEDALAGSERLVDDARAQVHERLRDLEHALHKRGEGVRSCDDGTQQARLKAGEDSRQRALVVLWSRRSPEAKALVERLAEQDPSAAVRTAASRLLQTVHPGGSGS